MKLLLLIFVVSVISEITYGAVSFSPPAKIKGSDGKYYCDYEKKSDFAPGESFKPPGECSIVYCNNDYSMNFESCGVASSDDCNYWGSDLTKEYPDCCNKICEQPIAKVD